jgi:hypothetical protein
MCDAANIPHSKMWLPRHKFLFGFAELMVDSPHCTIYVPRGLFCGPIRRYCQANVSLPSL